jgi:hypothetical protein
MHLRITQTPGAHPPARLALDILRELCAAGAAAVEPQIAVHIHLLLLPNATELSKEAA